MKQSIGAARPKCNYSSIPKELRAERTYIYWKLEQDPKTGKTIKRPINPKTMLYGGQNDPTCFVTLDEAEKVFTQEAAKQMPAIHGIGMAFKNDQIIGLDLDKVFDQSGNLKPVAKDILENARGFVEKSVSGTGYHIITKTDKPFSNYKDHDIGFEVFKSNMFIALTGDVDEQYSAKEFPRSPVDLAVLDKYLKRSTEAYEASKQAFDGFAQTRDLNLCNDELRSIVMSIQPPDDGYEFWLKVGMATHHQTRGSDEGLDIWKEYSTQDADVFGAYGGDSQLNYKWRTFYKGGAKESVTASTLRWLAKEFPKFGQAALKDQSYALEQTSATEYVIDGIIAEGIFVLAGQSGIGKTTLLLPLAAYAAHLCADGDELKPALRRPVLYLTEDRKQALRILSGLRNHCGVTKSEDEFNKWFQVRETQRMSKGQIAKLIRDFAAENKVYMDGANGQPVLIPPLIVADTLAATLDLEDENNNALVSEFISTIKLACSETGTSLWLIAHISKVNNKADIESMTARGASAFGADVHGTGFVIKDPQVGEDKRFLIMGKKRYEAAFNELCFKTERYEVEVTNRLGHKLIESYRVGFASKSGFEERKEEGKIRQITKYETEVMGAVRGYGQPYITIKTLSALMESTGGSKYQRLTASVSKLVQDGVLEMMSGKDAIELGIPVESNTKAVYSLPKVEDFQV
ncbi:AAA family ATPase [Polynucleobacter sp. KF022]|uniref:AAA family ATPase n=1 Tax=Polynucleobacter sp. KF022 TaxID=2982615 RepID=UPI0023770B63|nr:AAA family ATPase [Polynucleobacter sp. KF022]BDT74874.1 hypothetical protein PKF022_05390 [Polynucleobacter sp. KF022]